MLIFFRQVEFLIQQPTVCFMATMHIDAENRLVNFTSRSADVFEVAPDCKNR